MTDVRPGVALSGGRYALERLLGAGGMATVWLAVDRRLERNVAVKVLSDALAVDEAYIERFEREARLAAGLSHANLVAVYDFGNEGRPYLVMEHVDGPTLAAVVDREDGAGEVDPLILARALMGALSHIHRAGIVHRDVKPSNVLMGADERIRLTDFGIARPENGSRLTMTGLVMGTLRYLAPEVKAGGRSSQRSDLYASGILLRDVLGDRAGHERADPALREIVRRLCDEDPDRRPTSAMEALAGLPGAGPTAARTRAPRPERSIPPSVDPARVVVGRAPTTRQRGRTRATLALVCASVAVVAVALLTMGAGPRAPAPEARSTAPPASAPLAAQLDGIERAVRQGRP